MKTTLIPSSAWLALTLTGFGAALPEMAAKLQSQYADAVVYVQAVTESRGREVEVESMGTVIDSSGIVVVAHSRFTSNELKDVKLVLADGTEVPAKVALTDPDLDIAFIVVDKKVVEGEDIEFTHVPVSDALIDLQAADPVIILSRDSEEFRRQATVLIGHVETVVDTPRRYYRTDVRPPGTPAFDVHGHFVGIFARRVQGEKAHHRVILPAPAILRSSQNLPNQSGDTPGESEVNLPDPLKSAASKLVTSYGESIAMARIKLEIAVAVGEQSQTLEQTISAPCTIIRADGLCLTPDLTSSIVSQVRSQLERGAGGAEVNVKVEPKQIKLVLGDGTEIPSETVYQDRDLNLGFILPNQDSEEAEGVAFTPVNLDEHVELGLFEEVLALSRLGEDLNRELEVRSGHVTAIQRKPGLVYRTEILGFGAPVFNKDVKLAGFQLPVRGSNDNRILPIPAIFKSLKQMTADAALD